MLRLGTMVPTVVSAVMFPAPGKRGQAGTSGECGASLQPDFLLWWK